MVNLVCIVEKKIRTVFENTYLFVESFEISVLTYKQGGVDMLLQERLETHPFSPSEKVIVNYLLEQNYDIKTKSTAEIAKETFSSKSTLTRVAKKLNYDGWNSLKTDYLNELDYLEPTQLSMRTTRLAITTHLSR